MLDDPAHTVRDVAFSVAPARKGFLLRDDKWAYIQYGEDAAGGIELFDVVKDPGQFDNLANKPRFASVVASHQVQLADKLKQVRDNDLDRPASR
jgi:iduronate 2-sulfatase